VINKYKKRVKKSVFRILKTIFLNAHK